MRYVMGSIALVCALGACGNDSPPPAPERAVTAARPENVWRDDTRGKPIDGVPSDPRVRVAASEKVGLKAVTVTQSTPAPVRDDVIARQKAYNEAVARHPADAVRLKMQMLGDL